MFRLRTVSLFQVDKYFDLLETSTGGYIETKRVFIATDDPTVFAECRRKYPQFTFLGNETSAQIASDREKSRLSKDGLLGIIQVRSMLVQQFSSPYFFAIIFFRDLTMQFFSIYPRILESILKANLRTLNGTPKL